MANYLLDSNHFSPLVTIGHPLGKRIMGQLEVGDTFAICTPVLTETMFGVGVLPRAVKNLKELARLRLFLPCMMLDDQDGFLAANLQIALRRRGWQLATVDALIAATALRYDLILLTTDKDFREVPNLKQENWMAQIHK